MIMINESKKFSRNGNGRIERKLKLDDNKKLLLNKIKDEKKKKNKSFDEIKQLELLIFKIKYSNNPDKLQNALKEFNKIRVVAKNLGKIRTEILVDYTGAFGKIGKLSVGDQIRTT